MWPSGFVLKAGRDFRAQARFGALRRLPAILTALGAFAVVSANAQNVAPVQKALQSQVATDKAAAASQKRVDSLVDRTNDAANKYAQVKSEADSVEAYNKQLDAQVKSQEQEMASVQKQLDEIETTSREVQPLIERMVDSLDQFVSLDVPFLRQERMERVQRLRDLMKRADVSISEKYRQVLEAYQIELDYGTSFDSYEGVMGTGASARTVQFIRLGRVTLLYRTLDGSETGYWDAQKKAWVVDNKYAAAAEQALRVATKGGSPELLTLPVPVPQEVTQ
jgi:predicted RNase H-like nuclease (RuvC/YqgF family)